MQEITNKAIKEAKKIKKALARKMIDHCSVRNHISMQSKSLIT